MHIRADDEVGASNRPLDRHPALRLPFRQI